MKTLYSEHVERWKGCTACPLCEDRNKVVLARGTVPCAILFVGEAPGEAENLLGSPFVGPAGHLLDYIVKRAIPSEIPVAFTNLVACIPRDEEGAKTSEPDGGDIEACSVRLQEFVEIADPRLLVCVGKLSEVYLLKSGYKHSIKFGKEIPKVAITHPSAILRQSVAFKGLSIQRCIVTLTSAVEELLESQKID